MWNPEPNVSRWLVRPSSTRTPRHPLIGHEHTLNRASDISKGSRIHVARYFLANHSPWRHEATVLGRSRARDAAPCRGVAAAATQIPCHLLSHSATGPRRDPASGGGGFARPASRVDGGKSGTPPRCHPPIRGQARGSRRRRYPRCPPRPPPPRRPATASQPAVNPSAARGWLPAPPAGDGARKGTLSGPQPVTGYGSSASGGRYCRPRGRAGGGADGVGRPRRRCGGGRSALARRRHPAAGGSTALDQRRVPFWGGGPAPRREAPRARRCGPHCASAGFLARSPTAPPPLSSTHW